MLVTMTATAASPDRILKRGKTYRVPDDEGKRLVEGSNIFVGKDEETGKPRYHKMTFAVPAEPGAKVTPVRRNRDIDAEAAEQ